MVAIINALVLLVLPFAVFGSSIPSGGLNNVKSERDLRRDIFVDYDKLTRPVKKFSTSIPVKVGITPLAIQHMDEKSQVLTLNSWMFLTWSDDFLTWDPSEYGNIGVLRVPPSEVWKPDVTIYTSASDSSFMPSVSTNVLIFNNGSVMWVPPFTIKSRCPLSYSKNAKDVLECNIRIGSWTYSSKEADLDLYSPTVDLSNFSDNNDDWKLVKAVTSREDKYYPCCVESYPLVHFNVTVMRRFSNRI